MCVCVFSTQSCLNLWDPRQEYWSGLPCPPPGVFLTQGSNPGLLHCRQTLYHLSHQGSLKEEYMPVTKHVSSDYPFGDHGVGCRWNHCEMVLG